MRRGLLLFTIIITAVTNIFSRNELNVKIRSSSTGKVDYLSKKVIYLR